MKKGGRDLGKNGSCSQKGPPQRNASNKPARGDRRNLGKNIREGGKFQRKKFENRGLLYVEKAGVKKERSIEAAEASKGCVERTNRPVVAQGNCFYASM